MRMRGPCRSPRIAIGRSSSSATLRTNAIVSRCCACVPCEKLIRATFIPASTRLRSASRVAVAGPSVQTIFVRQMVIAGLSS